MIELDVRTSIPISSYEFSEDDAIVRKVLVPRLSKMILEEIENTRCAIAKRRREYKEALEFRKELKTKLSSEYFGKDDVRKCACELHNLKKLFKFYQRFNSFLTKDKLRDYFQYSWNTLDAKTKQKDMDRRYKRMKSQAYKKEHPELFNKKVVEKKTEETWEPSDIKKEMNEGKYYAQITQLRNALEARGYRATGWVVKSFNMYVILQINFDEETMETIKRNSNPLPRFWGWNQGGLVAKGRPSSLMQSLVDWSKSVKGVMK